MLDVCYHLILPNYKSGNTTYFLLIKKLKYKKKLKNLFKFYSEMIR